MAQGNQRRQRQRDHREIAIQAQLEVEVERLAAFIQATDHLHLHHLVGKSITPADPRQLQQHPPTGKEQDQADHAVGKHLFQQANLLFPRAGRPQRPVHTSNPTDLDQAQRATHGKRRHEQGKDCVLAQPRAQALAGVQQVETAQAQQGDHLIQAD